MKHATVETLGALRAALNGLPKEFEQACRDNPNVTRALALEHEHYRQTRSAVQALFEPLPSLETFAAQTLAEGIKKTFGLNLDVSKTYLFDAVAYSTRRQQGHAEPSRFVRSLTHHALQNFEVAATRPGGLDVPTPQMRSVILDSRGYLNGPPFDNRVDIDPAEFARLCRELDIGGQYHALLDKIYYPTPKPGESAFDAQLPVLDKLSAHELSAFRQNLHLALLRGAITENLHAAVLNTPMDEKAASSKPHATFGFLKLWGVELNAMLLITFANAQPSGAEVVLYCPHDSTSPIRQYASFEALTIDLSERIRKNLDVIASHIPDASRDLLLRKVEDHLLPLTFTTHNIHERVPDPSARLPLTVRDLAKPLHAELIYQGFVRRRDNALLHAVPTKAMDAKTFRDRLNYWESVAFNVLGLVGLAIPGLEALVPVTTGALALIEPGLSLANSLLMGVTLYQLGHEVYEGIKSWSNEDKQQAMNYLLDVIENIALMAALAAATGVVKDEFSKVPDEAKPAGPDPEPAKDIQPPSFIEELEEVTLSDGEQRLWKPDLAPYVQDVTLPLDAMADATGLHHHDGRTWLMLDGKTYAVKRSPASNDYRLEHRSRAHAYEPPLRHNGAGAWLHSLDRPREWDYLQLFRRLGPLTAGFDDSSARHILAVSGIDEGVLRYILSEGTQIPALLKDTLQRFRLDQQVSHAMTSAGRSARRAEFDKRYQQLPASQEPGAAIIQRIYTKLPSAVIDELLTHASPTERQQLATGKVPRRVGDEVRAFQQQLRLSRACEGLYLQSVDNTDTDRLILHSLQRLQGWAEDISLELRMGTLDADRVERVGPEQIPEQIIQKTLDGYKLLLGQQAHATLVEAVYATLNPAQRASLASAGITDVRTLTARLAQPPLLPRWALRKALKMQRPGPRSPMRLADGRIGYLLSGRGALGAETSRTNLLHQLNDLTLTDELGISSEQILSVLEAAGRSPEQIQERIHQLFAERRELQASLDATRPRILTGLGAQRANHEEIATAIWRQWIRGAVPELEQTPGTLHLQNMFIAEFPNQLPEFISSRINRLQLHGITLDHTADGSLGHDHFEAQLSALFRHFPQLESLDIERALDPTARSSEFATSLLLIVRSFPQLRELRFVNQNTVLFPLDLERLESRTDLTRLDLSGNRFDSGSRFSFPDLHFEYLGLDRMGMHNWPAWLNQTALERVAELSIRENRLTSVPGWLEENSLSQGTPTRINLRDNPVRPFQLRSLHLSQDWQTRRFSFNLSLPQSVEESVAMAQDQLRQLREATDQWANASSSSAPLSDETRRTRSLVGQAIQDYWLQQARGYSLTPLHLEEVSLSDLPPHLPEFFFNDIGHIRLRRVACTTEQLNALVRACPRLESLTLEGHVQATQALPSALVNSSINELNLRELGLRVDQPMLDSLALMPELSVLDLSGNHLSEDLRSPTRARHRLQLLNLSNTGLQRWPALLNDWLPNYMLNLDGNQLTVLPEYILENPPSNHPSVAISLLDNPLTYQTMRRAHLSGGRNPRYTFSMSLPEDLASLRVDGSTSGGSPDSSGSDASVPAAHQHSLLILPEEDVPDVEQWLPAGTAESVIAARRSIWGALEQNSDSTQLLALVRRLAHSSAYRTALSHDDFIERVWRVLEHASRQPEEQENLSQLASAGLIGETCIDGALMQFKEIEDEVFNRTLAAITPTDHNGSKLYQMVRREYRQRELDNIATQRVENRDLAELRLAYLRRLSVALDLRSPPDYMMYEHSARLRRGEIESVERLVREREAGEDFLVFATYFEPWTRFLRETHAERFAQLQDNYLRDEEALLSQDPEASLDEVARQLRDNVDALIRELTILAGQQQP
nr:hypothetical protein L321_23057 [Pseudomonas plecoglossicida NB2011]